MLFASENTRISPFASATAAFKAGIFPARGRSRRRNPRATKAVAASFIPSSEPSDARITSSLSAGYAKANTLVSFSAMTSTSLCPTMMKLTDGAMCAARTRRGSIAPR